MSNHKNPSGKNAPVPAAKKPAETKPAAPPTTPAGAAKPAASATPAAPAVMAHVPPLFRRVDWISCIITFLLTFIGYLWTVAPDLTLEDCGELAVGSYYAGVPHPPGYPVWTVYTWIFTWLVPVSNIAYRVAVSSAFAGAVSCGLVALMVSRGSSMILEGIAELKNVEKRWENSLCLVSGFVAGMLIGFNGFMWSQAVIVEVYTLSALSLTGVLCCLMRWVYAPHQRRYLYFAFFWFGITFNNHQSLLVVVLGLEAAIFIAAPRVARTMFMGNWVVWITGLCLNKGLGMIGMLSPSDDAANPNIVLFIYNLIGIASFMLWVILLVKTRISAQELGRDALMTLGYAYVLTFVLVKVGQIGFFEFKTPLWVLFNIAGVGVLGAMVYMLFLTWKKSREWLATIWSGSAFAVGAAFYLYMPLASMSNPPLNWGYPRTVQGFYHAFTRGQYERIHPTATPDRYVQQIKLYIGGLFEEMNFVFVLIGLIPFFFLRKMQSRERAWLIGLTATYFMLSFFLLWLLNPAPDRQSKDLNRVFFTASHIMVAMGIGYGVSILGAYLSTQLDRFKNYCLYGSLGAAAFALFMVAVRFNWKSFEFHSLIIDLDPSYNPIVRFTCLFSLALALAAAAVFFWAKTQISRTGFLALACLLPVWSICSHWYDNEQRGHYFGYYFGHDMFTPPFKDPKTGKLSYDGQRRKELLGTPEGKHVYPEMDRDTVLYGGTDPGRFNPTYMIFCESFIPPSKRNAMNPVFDRRDVYLITQNALADGTYLNYIRAHYNRSAQIDPPFFSELVRGERELQTPDKTNTLACALRPLDHVFLNLGDKIEEKRRAGSSAFEEEDFKDLPSFTSKLKAAADPLSKFLFDNLTKETQQLVSYGANEKATRRALARDLNVLLRREMDAWKELGTRLEQKTGYTNAINAANAEIAGLSAGKDAGKIQKRIADYKTELAPIEKRIAELQAMPSLYESNRFAQVALTPRTQRFIRQNPHSHTRIRLNRILLEEAYSKELAVSLGGVYPDLEIDSATNEDSQKCFNEYLTDAQRRLANKQLKPGEDVKIIDNKVQVSGQIAVMAINGLLTKVIFDKNPDHEFYVEESFPLDWMYPHLTPFGIIMKINRKPIDEMTEEMVYRDHQFWSDFTERTIGNWITYDTTVAEICAFADEAYFKHRVPKNFKGDPKFLRDQDGQKAFSKLRSSISGVYNWRITNSRNPAEQQRMIKEADFAFKQAYAFCPYSPEAIFRYVQLLAQLGRIDDAMIIATTSLKMDPFNAQIEGLIVNLEQMKRSMPRAATPPAGNPPAVAQEQINTLEAQFNAQPNNFMLGLQLASLCAQAQQIPKATEIIDRIVANPAADPQTLVHAADGYAQLGLAMKVEQALLQLIKNHPDYPEGRFQLAAVYAMQGRAAQAIDALSNSLRLSAARRVKDPAAPDIIPSAEADTRLAAIRNLPEFKSMLEGFKPK